MSKPGFIKLHRAIQDNWLWEDKPFSKGQAWIDLLMEANFADIKKPLNGEIVTFERGTVYRSKLELATRWGWSRKKVDSFLKLLEKDEMLSQKSTTKGTIITIENYSFYQDEGTTKEQQKSNEGATEEQQKSNEGTQDKKNKNIKKDKKEKNITQIISDYLSDKSEEFSKAFAEFIQMKRAMKNPVTSEYQLKLLTKRLESLSQIEAERIEIINTAVMNGWKSFFPLKKKAELPQKPANNFGFEEGI